MRYGRNHSLSTEAPKPFRLMSLPGLIRDLAGMNFLQLFILLLFPVLIVLAMVLLGYLSSERLARDMVNTEINRALDETTWRTAELLDPIRSLVRSAASLSTVSPDYFRHESSHALLDQLLAHSKSIDSIYIAMADGSFRMSVQLDSGYRVHGTQLPEETRLAHRWLDRSSGLRHIRDRFAFFNAQDKLIEEMDFPAEYDPRQRPWYQAAVSSGRLTVSDPYIFSTKGYVGITIAMPFFENNKGQLAGVVAADIKLEQVSQLLERHRISPGSISLLVNSENQVIAHPDPKHSAFNEGGRVTLHDLPSLLPAGISEQGMHEEAQHSTGGEAFLVRSASLSGLIGKPWRLVIAAPLADYLERLNERNRLLLLAGLASVLLELLLFFPVMRRIHHLHQQRSEAQQQAIATREEMLENLRNSELKLEHRVAARTRELHALNQKLEQLSITDALTGLWNRRKFQESLLQEWSRAARSGTALSLAVIDIDWFKSYNDTYGHLAGDQCLQKVARALQTTVCRAGDLLARIGGEEFVFLCANTNSSQACELAEKIRQSVEELGILHATSDKGRVTVSIGVASCIPSTDQLSENLFARADDALYRAKGMGRNCLVLSET